MIYNIINNYTYSNKSNLNKFLDLCATALAIGLGGKKIAVISLLTIKEVSHSKFLQKIALIVSVVIFPLGVLGGICLMAKKWTKEFSKIQAISIDSSQENQVNLRTIQKSFFQNNQRTTPIQINSFKKNQIEVQDDKINSLKKNQTFLSALLNKPEDLLKLTEHFLQPTDKALEGIFECQCPFANRLTHPHMRNQFEERVVESIVQVYKTQAPGKDSPLTIVSLGAGGMFAEFRLLHLLLSKGFSDLDLVVVDNGYGSEGYTGGFKAVSKYFKDNALLYPKVRITHFNTAEAYEKSSHPKAHVLFAEDYNSAPFHSLLSLLGGQSIICSLNSMEPGIYADHQSNTCYRKDSCLKYGGSAKIGRLYTVKSQAFNYTLGLIEAEVWEKTESEESIKKHPLIFFKQANNVAFLQNTREIFQEAFEIFQEALEILNKLQNNSDVTEEETLALLKKMGKLPWTKRKELTSDRDGLEGIDHFSFPWSPGHDASFCQPGLNIVTQELDFLEK